MVLVPHRYGSNPDSRLCDTDRSPHAKNAFIVAITVLPGDHCGDLDHGSTRGVLELWWKVEASLELAFISLSDLSTLGVSDEAENACPKRLLETTWPFSGDSHRSIRIDVHSKVALDAHADLARGVNGVRHKAGTFKIEMLLTSGAFLEMCSS